MPTTKASAPLALPFDSFRSIAEAVDFAARTDNGIRIYNQKGEIEHAFSYRSMRKEAIKMGQRLRSLGMSRGDRVAIIAETCPEFFFIFFGCQYAGLIPCPLPHTIYLGGKSAYISRTAFLTRTAQAALICLPDNLAGISEQLELEAGIPSISFAAIQTTSGNQPDEPLQRDELAYIQFSSGSTAEPKGIAISQAALANNIKGILGECIRIEHSDRAFSWLPLYHDMGLVGFLLAPLFAQISADYISPSTFARRPVLWLELMSRNRSTITYAPPFAYRLAEHRFLLSKPTIDLTALRIAGVGGDMIHPDILKSFGETMSSVGFDPASFVPSYGMAESTLMVSYARGLQTDQVNGRILEERNIATPADPNDPPEVLKTFVICGQSLSEHDLIVTNCQREPLPERHLGHVLIRGPSLMSNYVSEGRAHPTEFGVDGFLDTGDLGYLLDGKIVVTGRSKEMIIYNGRNIWPQDLELAAVDVTGSKLTRAAAFSVELDTGVQIVILIELPNTLSDKKNLVEKKVAGIISSSFGLSAQIVIVPPKTLPYTSSGKLSRSLARKAYLDTTITKKTSPGRYGKVTDAFQS